MAQKSSDEGFGLPAVLFVIFLVLKLTGHIDWSWWWVTSPMWIGAILVVALIIILELIKSK